MQNVPRANCITQRLTLRLVNNGDSPKLTTQRLTLGLYENVSVTNPYTSPAIDLGPVRKCPEGKSGHLPAMDPRTGRKWPEGKSDHLPSV